MATYYFSYGADLDPEDLGLRCEYRRRQRVRFAKSSRAVLKGFRLVCNIPSKYRQGGIFNIVPDPKGIVHGVAYEMHAGDTISAALIKEGESTNYLLALQSVTTTAGKELKAFVILADAESKGLRPAPAYLEIVIKAAERHKLPPEWISTLEGFSTAKDEIGC